LPDLPEAIVALDELTRRLRRECPWDREQDERSIVPHTVEEAYELADAANHRNDAKLLDELGDVLFQVCFLSLLLEERSAGDLAQVAEHCRQKLVRRHPHVFGEAQASDAAQVLRRWDEIKASEPGRERGVFGEVPENLPALLYARKLQRRAASAGLHPRADAERADEECFDDVGERLFALVDEARRRQVDPELALRAAAQRFRHKMEVQ
jgi:MazG family protein